MTGGTERGEQGNGEIGESVVLCIIAYSAKRM